MTAIDPINDLVLLKVSAHGVTPLKRGASEMLQVGETVYVRGNPTELEASF